MGGRLYTTLARRAQAEWGCSSGQGGSGLV